MAVAILPGNAFYLGFTNTPGLSCGVISTSDLAVNVFFSTGSQLAHMFKSVLTVLRVFLCGLWLAMTPSGRKRVTTKVPALVA